MTAHCDFCADPWRATLIGLSRKGLRVAVMARHYGLRVSTVTALLQDARKAGCLPPPTCLHCGIDIPTQRLVCTKLACRSARNRNLMRLRRARFGWRRKGPAKQVGGHKEPHDFVWPELPPNPRERTPRAPSPIVGLPIVHVSSLLGVGRMSKAERDEAVAKYLAGARPPAPEPSKPRAITPFRPLASPAPRNLWEATRTLRATGRRRPATSYVVPPPCCPTLGSLQHGRIAA